MSAAIIIARAQLLALCSRLFNEVTAWSLPPEPPFDGGATPPDSRHDSSDSLLNAYAERDFCIVDDDDVPEYLRIAEALRNILAAIEHSDRRNSVPSNDRWLKLLQLSGREENDDEPLQPTWVEYYDLLNQCVINLFEKWWEILPSAEENRFKMLEKYRTRARSSIFNAVKANDNAAQHKKHYEWESERHPVMQTAKPTPHSPYAALERPQPRENDPVIDDERRYYKNGGVSRSGVIWKNRFYRFYSAEDIAQTNLRNQEVIRATRERLAGKKPAPLQEAMHMIKVIESKYGLVPSPSSSQFDLLGSPATEKALPEAPALIDRPQETDVLSVPARRDSHNRSPSPARNVMNNLRGRVRSLSQRMQKFSSPSVLTRMSTIGRGDVLSGSDSRYRRNPTDTPPTSLAQSPPPIKPTRRAPPIPNYLPMQSLAQTEAPEDAAPHEPEPKRPTYLDSQELRRALGQAFDDPVSRPHSRSTRRGSPVLNEASTRGLEEIHGSERSSIAKDVRHSSHGRDSSVPPNPDDIPDMDASLTPSNSIPDDSLFSPDPFQLPPELMDAGWNNNRRPSGTVFRDRRSPPTEEEEEDRASVQLPHPDHESVADEPQHVPDTWTNNVHSRVRQTRRVETSPSESQPRRSRSVGSRPAARLAHRPPEPSIPTTIHVPPPPKQKRNKSETRSSPRGRAERSKHTNCGCPCHDSSEHWRRHPPFQPFKVFPGLIYYASTKPRDRQTSRVGTAAQDTKLGKRYFEVHQPLLFGDVSRVDMLDDHPRRRTPQRQFREH